MDEIKLEDKLNTICIENKCIRCNVARYVRNMLNKTMVEGKDKTMKIGESGVTFSQLDMKERKLEKSYVDALNAMSSEAKPIKYLTTKEQENTSQVINSIVAKLKNIESIQTICTKLSEEGFPDTDISYIRRYVHSHTSL